jgi:hypothetical protein
MGFGSLFAYFWLKKSPKGYDMYGFAVAAGMVAGEGLGGVLQALLAVAGVGGCVIVSCSNFILLTLSQ